ncbi:MAG: glycosyltransferase family 2 protein [Bacteriovoracaceae bacterium]|nr:glycosyltransferase family 2 protein [Bacteriovoracaceae bacterium]
MSLNIYIMANVKSNPQVSIIIPCYNEKNYIEAAINSFLNQNGNIDLEIIIVDGQSNDGTINIINSIKDNRVRVIDNPNKTTPFALNLGIKNALGDFILIAGAHSIYPNNLIKTQVSFLKNNSDFSCCGCNLQTIAPDNSAKSQGISHALSSSYGVGSSHFRTGVNSTKEVDTVAFGLYRKEVFDKVGLFDTQLTRNQDDEFNARLTKSKFKIALLPNPIIKYFGRKELSKLSKMMYQYGLFKPIVNKKIGSATTIRQFAPPFLVLTLPISILPYLLFLLTALVSNFKKHKRINIAFYFTVSIVTMHLSYGIGYLIGLTKVTFGKNKYAVSSSR